MEKEDVAFSTSVVEIRQKRKIKSKFLMFARLSAEEETQTTPTRLKKEKKRVLMFANIGVEKISETARQDLEKKKK